MAKTGVADLQDQVQEFWSPLFMPELLETNLLASLVNKDYEGEIKEGGDTVKVSQINRPNAQRKTVGAGADTFNPAKITTNKVDIKADTRIIASYEFSDLAMLQSQLGSKGSELKASLLEAANIELNKYLYEKVAPQAGQIKTGVTDFNASQVIVGKKIAGQQKWMKNKGWYLLADPSYHADMMGDVALTSADFVQDRPVQAGQMGMSRYGFNIFEDNSEGLLGLSSSSEDAAIAFHPDFLGLVMMKEPEFKLSDLHANREFGYVLSVDMIVGAEQLPEGEKKIISYINS